MILEYCRRKFWNCTEALNQVQLCSGGGGGGVVGEGGGGEGGGERGKGIALPELKYNS